MFKKNSDASREISYTPVSAPPPACTSIYVHQCGTEKCAKRPFVRPGNQGALPDTLRLFGKGKFFDGETLIICARAGLFDCAENCYLLSG